MNALTLEWPIKSSGNESTMALDDDIRVLSQVKLFKGFSREQLRLLAFGAENISLGTGRKLYSEGAPADCAFVVAAGEVALFEMEGNLRKIIALLGPGTILGELALISESERLTSAITQTDASLIRLNRSMFRRILEEYPELAEELHTRISKDLEEMLATFSSVTQRLLD